MDIKKAILGILIIIAAICVIFTFYTVTSADGNETAVDNSSNSTLNATVNHSSDDGGDPNIDDYHFSSKDGQQSSSSSRSGDDEIHETTVTNDRGEQETVKWSESEGIL